VTRAAHGHVAHLDRRGAHRVHRGPRPNRTDLVRRQILALRPIRRGGLGDRRSARGRMARRRGGGGGGALWGSCPMVLADRLE
jgi:hypothetical protein